MAFVIIRQTEASVWNQSSVSEPMNITTLTTLYPSSLDHFLHAPESVLLMLLFFIIMLLLLVIFCLLTNPVPKPVEPEMSHTQPNAANEDCG